MVQIQVIAPERVSPRKASVIYLADDAQGRELTLRAQEGGPFPSRFELSQWKEFAEIEAAALASVRWQPTQYEPEMKDLPLETEVSLLKLAVRGEPVFPKRNFAIREISATGKLQIAPRIYPLSGISSSVLPDRLPPFTATINAEMSSAPWRFLLRLNADGSVIDCVSLERGNDASSGALEAWLMQMQFGADDARPETRWITLGIEFTNQPVDGTDAR